jgi:hypothetical protein
MKKHLAATAAAAFIRKAAAASGAEIEITYEGKYAHMNVF